MSKPERELTKQRDAAKANHEDASCGLYEDADLAMQYPNEASFVRTASREIRQQMGLPANASADQVYHKMAEDFVKTFPQASPQLQREALANMQLHREQVGNERTVYQAIIARDRRETGTPDALPLSDLERNVHKRAYQQMKSGKLPIDCD